MKKSFLTFALVCALATSLLAGNFTSEFNADSSYVGGAGTKFANGNSGSVSEQSTYLHYVLSQQIGNGPLLRLGVDYQRYSFGLPANATIPNTMQSLNAVIGLDAAFYGWLVRVEAYPGFYTGSTGLNSNDFNVPFVIGGTYIVNENVQWILGLYVNFDSSFPVLPAAGLRWKFANQWTLDAVPPRPRLEYALSDKVTLYIGADLKFNTFRVSRDFGDSHGNSRLNHASLDYTEVRAGIGASYKISSSVKVEAEAGSLVYRNFDFSRADTNFQNYSGAPYGQIAISAQF